MLGATGVGKSTWINGLANYLAYESLEEAEENEFTSMIPISFKAVDDTYVEHPITIGSDRNEVALDGKSSTQFPKTYVFDMGHYEINLIDTPGIGDTDGPEKDKENVANILKYLSEIDKLHGICILLKPNDARVHILFNYCIKELFANLHKEASNNIAFCFTNSRCTSYKPGDTIRSLKAVMEQQNISIPLTSDTMFCMDNESVRFLAEIKTGYRFNEENRADYSKSWERSSEVCLQLMEHFAKIKPHKEKDTLSINESRRAISVLIKPLADATTVIQESIILVERVRQQLQFPSSEAEQVARTLGIPQIELHVEKLDFPLTVCNQCCVTFYDGYVEYRCEIEDVGYKCGSYDKFRSSWRCNCTCPLNDHEQIYYKARRIAVKDPSAQVAAKLVKNKDEARKSTEMQSSVLESEIELLQNEQKQITEACAKFAIFLNNNAIASYNDKYEEYLELSITTETKRPGGGDNNFMERLRQMQKEYHSVIQLILSVDPNKNISADDIRQLTEDLYKMEHMGKKNSRY